MESREERKRRLREKLVESIDYATEKSDEEIQDLIDDMLTRESKAAPLGLAEREQLRRELFHAIRKLDVLQDLVDDAHITEIMINGPEHIFVERAGRLYRSELRFESQEQLHNVIQQIVADCNRVVNEASPIVDARLRGGARVNVVLLIYSQWFGKDKALEATTESPDMSPKVSRLLHSFYHTRNAM